jgi:hypothetical protein
LYINEYGRTHILTGVDDLLLLVYCFRKGFESKGSNQETRIDQMGLKIDQNGIKIDQNGLSFDQKGSKKNKMILKKSKNV